MEQTEIPKRYQQLIQDVSPVKETIFQVLDSILNQDVSSYPILVLHQSGIQLGIEVALPASAKWSLNASSLEEFVAKQLIRTEKIEDFQSIYKSTDTHICFFVVEGVKSEFIFLAKKDISG